MKNLLKQVNFTQKVSFIRNYIWKNIIEAIHLQWPSIQIIYEQRDLLLAAQVEIQKTKEELANKPTQAQKLITFLNGKNRAELEEMQIQDRIETILQIKKVLTKINLMNSL